MRATGTRTRPSRSRRLRKAAALGFGGIYVKEDVGGSALTPARRRAHLRGTGAGLHLDRRLYLDPQHGGLDDRRLRRRASSARSSCPSSARMEHFASYCLTEPGSGSDAASLTTQRAPRRRALRARRRQGLHLRRRRLRHLCGDGAHRRGGPARHFLHRGGEGHARPLVRRAGEEARLEDAADRHGDVRELPRAGGQPHRRRGPGLQDRHGRARRRPAEHRRLLARRRAILPRPHHRLHEGAQAVRLAACRFPGAAIPHRRLRHRTGSRAPAAASRRGRGGRGRAGAPRALPRRPSASPPIPASRWSTAACNCTAATAICAIIRSSASCATCACTRSSKAPTRSCA